MSVFHPHSGWTDERVATLKKLWLEGLSCSQIAKQLGGATRNSVIGKAYRLGLPARVAASAPFRAAPRPVVAATRAKQLPKGPAATGVRLVSIHVNGAVRELGPPAPMPRAREIEPDPRQKTILHRASGECAWPISPPSEAATADTLFCCKAVERGPYCAEHAEISFNGAQVTKAFAKAVRRAA